MFKLPTCEVRTLFLSGKAGPEREKEPAGPTRVQAKGGRQPAAGLSTAFPAFTGLPLLRTLIKAVILNKSRTLAQQQVHCKVLTRSPERSQHPDKIGPVVPLAGPRELK